MTANEYQCQALRTAGEDCGFAGYGRLINGVMGLCGESGECVDIVKKFLYQGHELDRERLAEELGDVAWYLAVAAHEIGYDLDSVLQGNIRKLERRYPDGFSCERSVNRED